MNEQERKKVRSYYKQIKTLFPVYGAHEKRFFHDLKADIEEYILEKPETTGHDIFLHFGYPKDIVGDYIASSDTDYLYGQIKHTKLIKRGIVLCTVIILLFSIVALSLHYLNYVKTTEAIIKKEETVVVYEK